MTTSLCHSINCAACLLPYQPQNYVERAVLSESPLKRRTLFKVLRWVAYSLRPLEICELLVAVSTKTEFDAVGDLNDPENQELQISNQDDLLSLCGGLLGRTDNGVICFVHESVRDFVLSPAMRDLDAFSEYQVHEMMAMVCLRHVTCLDETALLKPWTSAGEQLQGHLDKCHLRDYSTFHWHQHFKIAESTSMYLTSLLHRALLVALQKTSHELGCLIDGYLAQERMTNQAFQYCCKYDFVKLGKVLLEMGANIFSEGVSAVYIAAAFGSADLLQVIIDRQVGKSDDSKYNVPFCPKDPYAPIEIAALQGRSAAVDLLLKAKSNPGYAPQSTQRAALFIAIEYGYEEVVEIFLESDAQLETFDDASEEAMLLAQEFEHHGIAKLISNSRGRLHPNTSPSAVLFGTSCDPMVDRGEVRCSRDQVVETLGLELRDLRLDKGALLKSEVERSRQDLPVYDKELDGVIPKESRVQAEHHQPSFRPYDTTGEACLVSYDDTLKTSDIRQRSSPRPDHSAQYWTHACAAAISPNEIDLEDSERWSLVNYSDMDIDGDVGLDTTND